MSDLRRDPVTHRWVIIATERAGRPTDFECEEEVTAHGFCPFCPGNEEKTPPEIAAYREPGSLPDRPGWRVRVVPNKHPALRMGDSLDEKDSVLFRRMSGLGVHEVIIESPDHDANFYSLPTEHVADVFKMCRARMIALSADKRLRQVVFFKNRGRRAGASLQHTHSQLIALPVVPKRTREEVSASRSYLKSHGRCIFCDIVSEESRAGVRVVDENDVFVVLSPYASRFPFELVILPKIHNPHFETEGDDILHCLAEILSKTFERIDRTLCNPPYNLLLHTAPISEEKGGCYHWHFELIPRLTRVAGFEWGSGFYINPVPPEDATRYLRDEIRA